MKRDSQVEMTRGAVALLDVLGWKGIWTRRGNPVDDLLATVSAVRSRVSEMRRLGRSKAGYWKEFLGLRTNLLLISDTIAVTIEGDERLAIELAAHIVGSTIAHGIQKGLPMRGAISTGEFYCKRGVFVGPAIDEVASWYEQTDWMGAVLCPSADLIVDKNGLPFTGPVVLYNAPVKGGAGNYYCVDWTFHQGTSSFDKFFKRNKLVDWLRGLGPITPELAIKVRNTMNFYDAQSVKLSIHEKLLLGENLTPQEKEVVEKLTSGRTGREKKHKTAKGQ